MPSTYGLSILSLVFAFAFCEDSCQREDKLCGFIEAGDEQSFIQVSSDTFSRRNTSSQPAVGISVERWHSTRASSEQLDRHNQQDFHVRNFVTEGHAHKTLQAADSWENYSISLSERAVSGLAWFFGIVIVVVSLGLLYQFSDVPQLLMSRQRPASAECGSVAIFAAPETSTASSSTDTLSTSSMIDSWGPVMFFGLLYITSSSALIKYNSYLLQQGNFPFAINLTIGHQVSGSVCLSMLYMICPSLFSSLSSVDGPRIIGKPLVGLVSVACFFGGQLVLSNQAYMYASVAFLQMMKEGNIVLVYINALIAGIEVFDVTRSQLLLCLLCSTLLTIHGELHFSLHGFSLQVASQLVEALKITTQSAILSGPRKLDSLSFNILVQPLTGLLLLALLLVGSHCAPSVGIASWQDYVAWWPHLVANAIVALASNLTVSLFIARTSAVAFILVGITKDAAIICADVLVSSTPISNLQKGTFLLQILFVASYSAVKTFSKDLEALRAKRYVQSKTNK